MCECYFFSRSRLSRGRPGRGSLPFQIFTSSGGRVRKTIRDAREHTRDVRPTNAREINILLLLPTQNVVRRRSGCRYACCRYILITIFYTVKKFSERGFFIGSVNRRVIGAVKS